MTDKTITEVQIHYLDGSSDIVNAEDQELEIFSVVIDGLTLKRSNALVTLTFLGDPLES